MKKIVYIFVYIICSSSLALAQTSSVFESSDLGIAFKATSQWTQLNEGNASVLELVNSNNNLKVKMWFECTRLDAADYLQTFLRDEGIAALDGPFELLVDNCKAQGIIGLCNEKHRPIKTLLLAIDSENGFYVVRFRCPDECFREHKKQMEQLIGSVSFMNKVESYLFYADQRAGL